MTTKPALFALAALLAGASWDAGQQNYSRLKTKVIRMERQMFQLDRKVKALETASRTGNDRSRRPTMSIPDASAQGLIPQIRLSLNWGTQIDLKDGKGRTGVHRAILGKQLRTLRYLLVNGADPETRTKEGKSPLELAREVGEAKMITMLREFGAS